MLLRRLFQITTGLLLGLAAVASLLLVAGRGGSPVPEELEGHLFPAPRPAPDFALEAHTGETVRLSDLEGRVVALFFGYTSCPDVCPVTMARLGQALERPQVDASRVAGVMISVDPAVDTPERLESFLARFHPSLLGLRGDGEGIREIATAFGAWAEEPAEPAAPAPDSVRVIGHTGRLFLLDRRGRIRMALPPDAGSETVARALAFLLQEDA